MLLKNEILMKKFPSSEKVKQPNEIVKFKSEIRSTLIKLLFT